MNRSVAVYGAVVVSMLCWSFSFVWYKSALDYYTPIGIITFRLTISAVLLLAAGIIFRQIQRIKLKDLKLLFLMTLFEPFIYSLCEANGMKMVSSTLAAVIVSTIPLFTPIGAYLFVKERISLQNGIGILLSVLGVTLVAYQANGCSSSSTLGIVLIFGAVVAAIGYAIGLKKITQRYNSFSVIAYQNILGALMIIPVFAVTTNITPAMFSVDALTPILKLTIFASTIAFILYAYSMKHLSIAKINVFINLIPVFTAIAAYYLLGDQFSTINLAGIGVTLGGLYVSQLNFGQKATKEVKA